MWLLLDTHAFLWWIFDDPRLSSSARTLIADSSAEILFSVFSTKTATNGRTARLALRLDVEDQGCRTGFTMQSSILRDMLQSHTQSDHCCVCICTCI